MSEQSGLNHDVIESLRELGGDDDLLEELIGLFLEDAPPRLKDLEKAVKEGDTAQVEAVAHSLKSSCANIGALRLSEICRDLEAQAREGCAADSLIVLSQEEYEVVRQELAGLV